MLVIIFSFKLQPGRKNIYGIGLNYYELTLNGGIVRLCPCYDADLFSDVLLRLLLVSEVGSQIYASLAFSFTEGDLKIKLMTLDP